MYLHSTQQKLFKINFYSVHVCVLLINPPDVIKTIQINVIVSPFLAIALISQHKLFRPCKIIQSLKTFFLICVVCQKSKVVHWFSCIFVNSDSLKVVSCEIIFFNVFNSQLYRIFVFDQFIYCYFVCWFTSCVSGIVMNANCFTE